MSDGKIPDKTPVGVLVSGRGSNLQALLEACADPAYPGKIACVISNKPGAYALERAEQFSVPTVVVQHTEYPDRLSFDLAVDKVLRDYEVQVVALAGFMRLLTPEFVGRWQGRMLNIHPSLLPAFKGLHTHRQALEAGAKQHGCTVHLVTPELDDGPILDQISVPVRPDDTEDSLAARVLEQEHILYPRALAKLLRTLTALHLPARE